MKKLELKHIAPYLPYELRARNTDAGNEKGQEWMGVKKVIGLTEDTVIQSLNNFPYMIKFHISKIIPLLIPLSALTEPMEDGSVPAIKLAELLIEKGIKNDIAPTIPFTAKIVNKPFGKMLKVTKCDEWYLMLSFDDPERIQHIVFEKLCEWHFDVYGLIDVGLAIDKRTVK